MELLEKLSHLGLIYEFKQGHFTISEDGPNMDGAELKALGEYFVSSLHPTLLSGTFFTDEDTP